MDTLEEQMKIFKQILFEKEMHFFKDYLETLEEFLRTEAQHLAQSLETLDLGYEPLPEERDGARDEDDYDAEHEQYYEPSPREVEEQLRDRLNDIDDFANLLRSSFFVSLYSFLESRLIKECESRKDADIQRSWSKSRGENDLEKFQHYFADVLQISFPGDTPQWQEIQNYRVLRNCIVHNRGALPGFNKRIPLETYINQKSDKLRISGDEIFFNTPFCSEAFETVKEFFCLLISSGQS